MHVKCFATEINWQACDVRFKKFRSQVAKIDIILRQIKNSYPDEH